LLSYRHTEESNNLGLARRELGSEYFDRLRLAAHHDAIDPATSARPT